MVRRKGFNFLKYGVIGVISGTLSFVIASLIKYFDIPAYNYNGEFISITASTVEIDLRNQIVNSGYFATIGQKFIDLLTALNFDATLFIQVILGTILILFTGRILVGFLQKLKPQSKIRVFLSYVFGGAALGIIIIPLTGLNFIFGFLALLLYSTILGIIMQLAVLSKKLSWLTE